MKSFSLALIIFFYSCVICAQGLGSETSDQETKSNEYQQAHYTVAVGVNVLDNGASNSPFNSVYSFKTPFFITAERRFNSKLSVASFLATNRLSTVSVEKSYFSVDILGQFYFDDYLFNTDKIEMYAGVGLGRFFLENNGNNTLNVTGGGRYWLSNNYGLSVQGFGKVGLSPINTSVLNHYQYNFGIVWRTSFKKANSKGKKNNQELSFLDDEKTMDVFVERVSDKIVEKLKSIKEELPLNATSEKKIEVVLNSLEKKIVSKYYYTGDWYLSATKNDGLKIFNAVLHSITFENIEDDKIWISDDKRGVWLKCEMDLNTIDGTFSAQNEDNLLDDGTVIITEGKIEKGAAFSKSGTVVDKISFKAQFSYDLNTVILFVGHKSTGQKEDRY